MTLASLADKLRAVLKRDLLIAARYRTGFVMTALGGMAELGAFYYLSRAVGPAFRPEGFNYFAFLLVGTGFYTFLILSINAFLRVVQEAQQFGTLEVLMTTATPGPTLVFLSAVSTFAGNTAQLVLYLGAGLLLFDAPLPRPNIVGCALVLVFSFGIAVAIGMLAAALQLSVQKGSAVLWLFGSGAWFLTGTLFPVTVLPRPLHLLSAVIPVTHCLNAMRLAFVQGAEFSLLAPEISILALFCLTLLPLSVLAFSYVLRQARQQGTLSFY
jgi:ABC-2 type transport system permease protein